MHYGPNGREPINGLTYERATPPYEFSKSQKRYLQNWACGYYNLAGWLEGQSFFSTAKPSVQALQSSAKFGKIRVILSGPRT